MKYNSNGWRIPMTNLQLFADGDDGGSGTGDGGGTGEGTGAKSTGASGNEPMSFDDFLKLEGNQAEFDRRVQKATQTAVNNAQQKWKTLTDDKISEAEKLAQMTKEERAEYKAQKLQKELDDYKKKEVLSEMSKTARKMLADEEISIPDELLSHLVSDSADDTKKAVDSFVKLYKAAVQAAVRKDVLLLLVVDELPELLEVV
ncbi:MAG: DUF4355 domain-containing protein [Schaedlerella sp.]|nr:DUF4355 domain-containing protein [Lachnospiraceae bacterium]MDY4203135.1 DUF4355 domain-containing protein [Schaedlerella sp.]